MVRDKDKGLHTLVERLKDLQDGDGWTIQVGVLDAEGEAKIGHDGNEEPVSLADVAAFHEYGLGVPQRSFIGAYFDEHDREIHVRAHKSVEAYLKGTIDKERCLAQVGSFCVGGIQVRISQGIEPWLLPSTIKAKGSSVPLVDTGQLRSSITWKVKP